MRDRAREQGGIATLEELYKKASPQDNKGCRNWLLSTRRGYGQLRFGGKYQYAHRVSWMLLHGAIPEGLKILHRCDNPLCVEVSHLWLGSTLDNNRDRTKKGRGADMRGEKHPNAKLSNIQRAEIVEKYRSGLYTHKRLGDEYGVTAAATLRIWSNSLSSAHSVG